MRIADIDATIANKDEAYWLDIKNKTIKEIDTLENMLKFNKAILEMAIEKFKQAGGNQEDDKISGTERLAEVSGSGVVD